jgi:hypothetical protein
MFPCEYKLAFVFFPFCALKKLLDRPKGLISGLTGFTAVSLLVSGTTHGVTPSAPPLAEGMWWKELQIDSYGWET